MSIWAIDDRRVSDYATRNAIAGRGTTSDKYRNAVHELESADPNTRLRAYLVLRTKFPAETRTWLTVRLRQLSVQPARYRISDSWKGLNEIAGPWGNVTTTVLNGVLPGVGTVVGSVVSFVEGVFSNAPVDPDPNNPGRSTHDARTYMEQLPKLYPTKSPARGNPDLEGNVGAAFVVPVLPRLDQTIGVDHPGHIFLSWNPADGTWISDWARILAAPAGAGYSLIAVNETGKNLNLPGYYRKTTYTDGATRYDYAGGSPPAYSGDANVPRKDSASTAILTGGEGAGGGAGAGAGAGGSVGTWDVPKIIEMIKRGERLPQDILNFISGIPELLALYRKYAGGGAGKTGATGATGGAGRGAGGEQTILGLSPGVALPLGAALLLAFSR